MKPVIVESNIHAPPDAVFDAIVDIERLPETSPDTVSVEFIGEQRSGAGTRFRDTRTRGRKTQVFELELTECDPQARTARFVNVTDGTVWDTAMSVVTEGEGSRVRFVMEGRTDNAVKDVMHRLFSGMMRKAMHKQVAALKAVVEADQRSGTQQ